MAALIAMVLFTLAAFGVKFSAVDIVDLGLAFLALHLLVGTWPFNFIHLTRSNQNPGS